MDTTDKPATRPCKEVIKLERCVCSISLPATVCSEYPKELLLRLIPKDPVTTTSFSDCELSLKTTFTEGPVILTFLVSKPIKVNSKTAPFGALME